MDMAQGGHRSPLAEARMNGRFWRGGWASAGNSFLAANAILLLCSGCGNKTEPPAVVSVKGNVVCQGKAVPGVLIKFWPRQQDPQTKPIETVSGPKGEFSLSCPKGSYKVTIANVPVSAAGPGLAEGGGGEEPHCMPAVVVPIEYSDRVESPLTVEVPEGGMDRLKVTVNK